MRKGKSLYYFFTLRIAAMCGCMIHLCGCGSFDRLLTAAPQTTPANVLTDSYVGPGTYPVKWKQATVTYAVDPGASGKTDIPGVNSYATDRTQFKRWIPAAEAGGINFQEITDPSKALTANIVMHFVPNNLLQLIASENGGTGSYQGYSILTVESDTTKLGDPNKLVKVDTYLDSGLAQWRVAAVGMHEWGRACGIRTDSPFAGDVMYNPVPNFFFEVRLTQRDVDSMRAIYLGYTTAGK